MRNAVSPAPGSERVDRRDHRLLNQGAAGAGYVAPMVLGSATPASAQAISGTCVDGMMCATNDCGGGTCACITTTEGGSACVVPSCAGATACTTSADCGANRVCFTDGCCGAGNVCVTLCGAGAPGGLRTRPWAH